MQIDLMLRLEVETLLAEWAWRVDEGRAASAAELFCEDAEQNLMGNRNVGIDAIRAAFRRRQGLPDRVSQHIVSNVRITHAESDFVHAQWVVTLFRSDTSERSAVPFMVGVGKDQYRRVSDGSLRIFRREILSAFGG